MISRHHTTQTQEETMEPNIVDMKQVTRACCTRECWLASGKKIRRRSLWHIWRPSANSDRENGTHRAIASLANLPRLVPLSHDDQNYDHRRSNFHDSCLTTTAAVTAATTTAVRTTWVQSSTGVAIIIIEFELFLFTSSDSTPWKAMGRPLPTPPVSRSLVSSTL